MSFIVYPTQVEGIGYDFIPDVLHRDVVDRWIKTNDAMSFPMIRRLILEEGILSGGSSGSVLAAAMNVAKDLTADQNCVVILPDGIRNYMSKFVTDNWLEARQFKLPENEFKHWWWRHVIADLKFKAPVSITEQLTTLEALEVLKSHSLERAPVVSARG